MPNLPFADIHQTFDGFMQCFAHVRLVWSEERSAVAGVAAELLRSCHCECSTCLLQTFTISSASCVVILFGQVFDSVQGMAFALTVSVERHVVCMCGGTRQRTP